MTDYELRIRGTDTDLILLTGLIGLGLEHMNITSAVVGHPPVEIGDDSFPGQLLFEIKNSAVDELPELNHAELEQRLRDSESNAVVQLEKVGGSYE